MKSYKMYPRLYTENFQFTTQQQRDIVSNSYKSLKDAVEFARQTRVCLREMNWYVYEVTWFGVKRTRISLKTLQDIGLLSEKIAIDHISLIYNWKDNE